MGAVTLTNLTGATVSLNNFTVNNSQIVGNGAQLGQGATGSYFYGDKNWDDFQDLNLDVVLNGSIYHVNLNRSHYFSGGDFHYPGNGSVVSFVLLGTDSSASSIRFQLAYRPAGAATLLYSSDTSKSLDRK